MFPVVLAVVVVVWVWRQSSGLPWPLGAVRNRSRSYAIELTFGNNDWASLEQPLDKFLAAVVEGWKRGSASARRSAESNLLDS